MTAVTTAREKILVVKRDKIGDMLLTTPLLATLRQARPDAQIDVLATDYNAWVLRGNPDVNQVFALPRIKVGQTLRYGALAKNVAMRARLALQRYDWVIVAQGEASARAVSRGRIVRSRRLVAYSNEPANGRSTDPISPPLGDQHEVDRMLRLLGALGIDAPTVVPHPRFYPSDAQTLFVRDWLAEHKLRAGGYVMLGLGARRPARQPSAPQIARWSAWWLERYGLATVFVWTPGSSDNPVYPGDDQTAEPVLKMNLPNFHPYRGPIAPTIGLIWSARTSVFPDSGLAHFAGASPGGVLALFAGAGGPPATQWAPRGAHAQTLTAANDIPAEPDAHVFALLESRLRVQS